MASYFPLNVEVIEIFLLTPRGLVALSLQLAGIFTARYLESGTAIADSQPIGCQKGVALFFSLFVDVDAFP